VDSRLGLIVQYIIGGSCVILVLLTVTIQTLPICVCANRTLWFHILLWPILDLNKVT